MTYFLIFLAVVVAAIAGVYLVGLKKPQTDTAVYGDVLGAPVANLPPVLLPSEPAPADVDKLRFSLGLRGYRMDQVDEVLDRLRDELAAKDLRIAELEAGTRTEAVALPEPVQLTEQAEQAEPAEPAAPVGPTESVQPGSAS